MAERRNYLSKLENARVLILGGSSGIGFGLAEALLQHGASVLISSSSPKRVNEAVDRLRHAYPSSTSTIEGYACNLGSADTLEGEVRDLFGKAAQGGKLDHVVFTAGDPLVVKNINEFTLQEIHQTGLIRFFAPFIIAQQLRQHLRPGPAASYTITTGGVPEHIMPGWAVLQAYMTGLSGLTRGLAVDLAPIRVNVVGFGPVETELWDPIKEAGLYRQIASGFEAKMTLGAVGKIEDVVESYLYCMKDRNVSGSILYSHGGTLLL